MSPVYCWHKIKFGRNPFKINREVSLQPESRLALQTAQEVQLIERRDQSEEIGSQKTHLLMKN